MTTEIKGLTHSTNYSVEVVGIDTMGKPYKTPSEATKTANRKRGNAFVFSYFCEFVFCFVLFCFFYLLVLRKVLKLATFHYLRGKSDQ